MGKSSSTNRFLQVLFCFFVSYDRTTSAAVPLWYIHNMVVLILRCVFGPGRTISFNSREEMGHEERERASEREKDIFMICRVDPKESSKPIQYTIRWIHPSIHHLSIHCCCWSGRVTVNRSPSLMSIRFSSAQLYSQWGLVQLWTPYLFAVGCLLTFSHHTIINDGEP